MTTPVSAPDPRLASGVRRLSDRLVALQRPVRILNALAWTDDIKHEFFAGGATAQPRVDAAWYRSARPLRFDATESDAAFVALMGDVAKALGGHPVGALLTARAAEYRQVLRMLEGRGTDAFHAASAELYGASSAPMYPGGPTLASLGEMMSDSLANIAAGDWQPPDEGRVAASDGVALLQRRLDEVFAGDDRVQVRLDDGIVADAAAGSDYIKLRDDASFTTRDLRVLEVHEGWVHVGTSLNGRRQPWCTFLGKGTPSTTVTQEGLAVFTEVTTLSSTPSRLRRVTRRITAIAMAEDGATFLDVYRWMLDQERADHAGERPPGDVATADEAWTATVRVFRGSTPEGAPFTKDLVYSRGFLEVYNFIRLAVRRGIIERIPMLFCGKMAIAEVGVVAALVDEGLVTAPEVLPPHVSDVSALASWMAYSNLLNHVDINAFEQHLAPALT